MSFDNGSETTSALLLFDDYAIPDDKRIWRRPTPQEIPAQPGVDENAFTRSAHKKASFLKIVALFAPYAKVDAVWLFNNPHLFYLASLPPHHSDSVAPLVKDRDFLRSYWGNRPLEGRRGFLRDYETMLRDNFPTVGRPTYRDNSWLVDIYQHSRRQFELRIRKRLQEYVNLLGNVTSETISEDPGTVMRTRLTDLMSGASSSDEVFPVFKRILDDVDESDGRFRIPRAFDRIEQEVPSDDKRCELRWMIYNSIYLPAHVRATRAGPSGFNNESVQVGPELDISSLINDRSARADTSKPDHFIGDLLGDLSFENLMKHIRRTDEFNRYRNDLRGIENLASTEKQRGFEKAVLKYLSAIGPTLYRLTNRPELAGRNRVSLYWQKNRERLGLFADVAEFVIDTGLAIPIVKVVYKRTPLEEYIDRSRGRKILINLLQRQATEASVVRK